MSNTDLVKLSIRLTPAQAEAARAAAQRDDRSVAYIIRQCVEFALPAVTLPVVEQFDGHPLDMVRHADDAWMTAEQIGEALEYSFAREAIMKIYERNAEELDDYTCVVNLTTQAENGVTQNRQIRVFNEEGVMLICMWSKQPKAKAFRQWAVAVLKKHRQGEARRAAQRGDYTQDYIKLLNEHSALLHGITEMQQRLIGNESSH